MDATKAPESSVRFGQRRATVPGVGRIGLADPSSASPRWTVSARPGCRVPGAQLVPGSRERFGACTTGTVIPAFEASVQGLKTFLANLRDSLEPLELQLRAAPAGTRGSIEETVLGTLEARIVPRVLEWMDRFDALADTIDDDARESHRAYARRHLHPLLLGSPFVRRALRKPLGYAGDYEMVNMILRDPREGATLFAKIVNVVFLRNPPAIAHRNRIRHLKQRIAAETARITATGRPCRILNLGCGPAREVQEFLAEDAGSNHADVTLLDFNGETLEFVREHLGQMRTHHRRRAALRFEQQSIGGLLGRSRQPDAGPRRDGYDFVYCAGLFDYASDRICSRLAARLHGMLAPGGLLLVTNVDDSKPFRQSMEYLLDWRLVYRDRDRLRQLVPDGAAAVEVLADPTGVNLFLEVRRRVGRGL